MLAATLPLAYAPPVGPQIRDAVQPILAAMAHKYNMSFQFGFVDASTPAFGAAAGRMNAFNMAHTLQPSTLIPLGSVTKPWTAARIMQAVEAGRLGLDDAAHEWVDPVLRRMWNSSLEALWGKNSTIVTIRDLLGMTSGFADYDDAHLEALTLRYAGDDVGPFVYLTSAARQGWLHQGYVCAPRTCAAYSGANFVLLGLVLVNLDASVEWQDMNQRDVIPKALRHRYQHTSFLRLGRCAQYEHVAPQYAQAPLPGPLGRRHAVFLDMEQVSCLNGWTMGNIATSAMDLATFFYDLATMTGGGGFVNATSLAAMTDWHNLSDTWCWGPRGPGSCQYGLGLFRDQYAQDWWPTVSGDPEDARVNVGHPGEDWGSGVSPCGYNARYGFGVCIAYTALEGMNCTGDFRRNDYATFEASCLVYDAVLAIVGGSGAPRLNCSLPALGPLVEHKTCEWRRENPGNHSGPPPIGRFRALRKRFRDE